MMEKENTMKNIYFLGAISLVLLNGCAGGTTDPRKGGLFSYNPAAYEQRLAEREQELAAIESDTAAQKRKSAQLKRKLASEKKKTY
jgi:PBP1b-binding outer membrane lipoprotein LpoB